MFNMYTYILIYIHIIYINMCVYLYVCVSLCYIEDRNLGTAVILQLKITSEYFRLCCHG